MPAGRLFSSPPDSAQIPDDGVTLQTKRCSACQGPLNADAVGGSLYASESSETASLCNACRESRLAQRTPLMVCPTASAVVQDGACDIDVPLRVLRNNSKSNGIPMLVDRQHEAEASSSDEDVELHDEERAVFGVDKSMHVSQSNLSVPVPVPSSPLQVQQQQQKQQHSYPQRNPSPISISPTLRLAHPRSPVRQTYPSTSETRTSHVHDLDHDDGYPDPLADITRMRVRSKGYRCLQPGATFKGTQKSGRNSYDVNVTIVDVDFASSFLCGYLRIRGLTDDWPELTTYFDAQIIGMRHGFDTQDWGASRQEDMVHWGRFPAFRAVQKDLIEPRMLLPANTARTAVFMRWKERFLVPDHRVQDISGASFAGFYYVCVDFDPEPESESTSQPVQDLPSPMCVESGFSSYSAPEPSPYPSPYSRGVSRSHSHASRHGHGLSSRRKPSSAPVVWDEKELAKNITDGEPPKARMCGFYYHKNSEPYQQLSLTHVESRFHSSFEFR